KLPATSKWFHSTPGSKGYHELIASYLSPYASTPVPLELTRLSPTGTITAFERFEAPLSVLLSHITDPPDPSIRLYLAQCPLEDLPADLRADVPMPDLLRQLGKGDIYGSSVWIGRPPTMTPLHRDPNPNLFVQLAGRKVLRLMRPGVGREVYLRAREGRGHANMRGEEMMAGEENRRLEKAVWGDVGGDVEGYEAVVESGDGLYIPLGWWHSVRGIGEGVNGSVNWWFR
ncbi:Clavaminate synthase-like protein, partial [Sporormia fimetaria CBS 119925]